MDELVGLWNVYSPNTYIEINLNRAQKIYDVALIELNIPDSIRQGVIEGNARVDESNLDGWHDVDSTFYRPIPEDLRKKAKREPQRSYDGCPPEFVDKVSYMRSLLQTVRSWQDLKRYGLPKSHFIALLIPVLFLNSIFCAILALVVRKKEQFIKTN